MASRQTERCMPSPHEKGVVVAAVDLRQLLNTGLVKDIYCVTDL